MTNKIEYTPPHTPALDAHTQTAAAEDTLERVAAGESELARAESELRRLLTNNGAEIEVLRKGQKQLRESSE